MPTSLREFFPALKGSSSQPVPVTTIVTGLVAAWGPSLGRIWKLAPDLLVRSSVSATSVGGLRPHRVPRGGFGVSRAFEQRFPGGGSKAFSLSLGVCGRRGQPWVGSLGRVSVGGWRPLSSCLTVVFLLPLVSDKMFPALGFGAQLPPDWKVSEARLFLLGQDGLCVCVSPRSALEGSGAELL